MELNEAYRLIEKNLEPKTKELGFSKVKTEDETLTFKGNKGIFRVSYDNKTNIVSLEKAYEDASGESKFKNVSKSLLEVETADERDCRSISNEIIDEIEALYKSKNKNDIEKIKMPKAVSRAKAKSGVISYDVDSLANRFGILFPDLKDDIKKNLARYGEFLPETFFTEIGTPRVIDVIKNGTEAEQKKLFKMLGDVYEDGTNEVQDIIGVTILGEMKNDPQMMAVADKYMTEYMAGPVHEINKITAKNGKWTKKLKNPPAYKPKKKKANVLQNALTGENM